MTFDIARWVHHRVICRSCQSEIRLKILAWNFHIWVETGVTEFEELTEIERRALKLGLCPECG